MIFPSGIWVLTAIAATVSAMGFYKWVYFISLGYGFSIAGQGVALLALYGGRLSFASAAVCVLLILYGLRLGGFLLLREVKSSAYRKAMKTEIKDGRQMKLGVKAAVWLACAALYVLQVSPVLYRLANGSGSDGLCFAGAAVMLFGLLLEAVADAQKSAAKKKNPKRFCDSGVYRLVRCPNYLGELIFWTGVLLSGAAALRGAGQWCMALLGYLGIVYVMFSGTRRLEIRQNHNYGANPAYQAYVKATPILLPFVPLYSVEKYRFLVG